MRRFNKSTEIVYQELVTTFTKYASMQNVECVNVLLEELSTKFDIDLMDAIVFDMLAVRKVVTPADHPRIITVSISLFQSRKLKINAVGLLNTIGDFKGNG